LIGKKISSLLGTTFTDKFFCRFFFQLVGLAERCTVTELGNDAANE
jgi:hypothetical protein